MVFGINQLTAVNTPFDLIKLDSEAASLKVIPSNLSLCVSPIKKHVKIIVSLRFDNAYLANI